MPAFIQNLLYILLKTIYVKYSFINKKYLLLTGVTSRMYASTPLASPSTKTEHFSASALFSCIAKPQTPSTTSRLTGNANTNARKLTFDDTEDSNTKVIEKSILEESPASFNSATKVISPETIMRRRSQRTRVNVRRLFADDDDQNVDESLPKSHTWSEDRSKEVQTMESLTKNTPIIESRILTPINTPKRERLPRRYMKARRLSFGDEENDDATFFECLSKDCMNVGLTEDTTVQNSEGFDSTILVLNVGICILPIRNL